MYLRKVHIKNIRSIAKLDWEIPEGQEAGWHVVIGDNGSGKTTFLRAISLVLIGEREAAALRQDWDDWLRKGVSSGRIELDLNFDPQSEPKPLAGWKSITMKDGEGPTVIEFSREEGSSVRLTGKIPLFQLRPQRTIQTSTEKYTITGGEAYITTALTVGGFSAAYGPFRRFSGGDPESDKIYASNPYLAAHLSIFGEDIALTECLRWLKDLDYRKAKKQPEGALLDRIRDFVNQEGFLPHQAKLTEISPDGVTFTDGEGRQVPVEELSDGYRSVLSLTFELIRQLVYFYGQDKIFDTNNSKIIAPGVVLIDEVDAHLHPTWQRQIGLWFRKHFPNIQFIVTTHSPLVCQAAEHGSVWRLPKPGSGDKAEQVTGVELNRLLYGNVLDAYGTELFGEDVGRSDAGKELLQQLAVLNVKEVNQGLSKAEKKKQQELRATFPTSQPATNGQRKKGK